MYFAICAVFALLLVPSMPVVTAVVLVLMAVPW